MADNDRLRRPVLDRTTPIRNWSNTVSPGLSVDSEIEPGVRNANRVVEDYLRAGEASARLFRGALGTGSVGGNPQDVAQRMFRAASDLMGFWIEFMARSTGGATPTTGPNSPTSPPPVVPNKEAGNGEPPRVAVEVESGRATRVTVDLRPHARGARLYLGRLHSQGANTPPLLGTAIDTSSDDHLVVIRLRIDSDQPAGVYNGVIIDEATSAPAGTISVAIQAARNTLHPESRE